ncbi:MAG: FHA domain-containing protein [Planctomycetes bacterium]|nr:FHA domain-containing protein [Planctomycetota bacterium]
MSFHRFVFYCAFIGGWSAFAGWLLSEALFMRRSADISALTIILTSALVGGSICGGLNLLAGAAHGTLRDNLPRLWIGLGGGAVGGALGGLIGNLLFSIHPSPVLQALGWMFMGLGIGVVEGVYDRSWKKIRNGLIGGGAGGLLGGLLLAPIAALIGGVMASRATSFVILGLCIGLLVGLAQVILKEAWLTVVEGFRPGRQVALSLAETLLGTSEKVQLPFIAFGAKGVEPIHLRILRQQDGRFVLQDNNSRTGTMLNGARVAGPTILHNDDGIQLGPNVVRYCERFRQGRAVEARPAAVQPLPAATAVPAIPAVPAAEAIKPAPARPQARPMPVQAATPPAARPGRMEPSPPSHAPPTPPRSAPAASGITAKPTPPRPGPPSPVFDAITTEEQDNSCPICGREIKGPTGRRLCDNCGIKF